MDRETFINLQTDELVKIVRASGPQACVFPINGTRRWFSLEHGDAHPEDYTEIISKQHIRAYELFFNHGLDTLLTPAFGGELLSRGGEYVQMAVEGLARLATHPDFLDFYQTRQVRVHFYGDYRKLLAATPYAYISDLFDQITERTARNTRHSLFYGVFASDATETIAEMSISYYRSKGQVPTREDLITQYYGEYIEKANIFIGFEKFNVFDYPMLGWGEESLYFTAAPSLYIGAAQLRAILYDHIFLRPVQDPDYHAMPPGGFERMRRFYELNQQAVYGIGEMRSGIWYAKTEINEA
jgi:tuberculosinol/isotuberculosinol synthase